MSENHNFARLHLISTDTNDINELALPILDTLGFGVIVIDADSHKIIYANSKILSMGGYAREAVVDHLCHKLLCPAEIGHCPITEGQKVDNSERVMIKADGEKISIIKTVVPVKLKGKNYLIESILDNTERRHMQQELRSVNENLRFEIIEREKVQKKIKHLAYHDHLTGLPNRLLFIDLLNHAISLSKRLAKLLTIMFIDLDDFKTINDSMGHAIGDQLLIEVSKRLAKTTRKSDIIARTGGDEFIIMIENEESIDTIKLVVEKVLNSFTRPFNLDGHDFYVTASIGVAIYPADGNNADTLIKNADVAMYKAKEKGHNQYLLCTPVMKTNIIETMKLSNKLYGAIDRNELEVYYQPQVECSSNKIIGLEALLRWKHPELGMVPPGKFIPIAEQSGLIIAIGKWVLLNACRQVKAWQDAGLPKIRIAVNLSVRQFQDPGIVKQVKEILVETNLDPQYLELEITESIVMKETGRVVDILKAFKNEGIAISIDDFGTEYSSLNYLKQLPVDKIKIAMPFVQGINVSDKDEAITMAIIVLAKSLGLRVIAEGVETQTQFMFLHQRMCDEIQGYYYFKPMPSKDVEELLNKSCQ